MAARVANIILGTWLFFSAYLWPHDSLEFINAVTAGMLVATLAVLGLSGRRWSRVVNAVIGAWLAVSALILPRLSAATSWNHLFVGIGIVIFAAVPRGPLLHRRSPAA